MATAALAKLTSKGQTTIPKEVREALDLRTGDALLFEVSGNVVTLRRAAPLDVNYLAAVQQTLEEWGSAEDDEAYREL